MKVWGVVWCLILICGFWVLKCGWWVLVWMGFIMCRERSLWRNVCVGFCVILLCGGMVIFCVSCLIRILL